MSAAVVAPRNETSVLYAYEIGQIVWAKLKGYPMWPALTVDPNEKSDLKRSKKRIYCVKFFGAGDYSFVSPEEMKPYFLYKKRFTASSKKSNFIAALRDVEVFVSQNPGVKDMEAGFKKPDDDQLHREWGQDTKDDDVASDYSEEINESAGVDQPTAAPQPQSSAASTSKKRKRTTATAISGHIRNVARKVSTETVPVATDSSRALPPAAVVENAPILQNDPTPPTAAADESAVSETSDSVSAVVEAPSAPVAVADRRPPKRHQKLGFIGLGVMGSMIAKSLIDAGYDLVLCPGVGSEKDNIGEFENCEIVERPLEIGERCDLIFSCLTDCDDALQVLFGRGSGIWEKFGPTKSYIEFSALDVGTSLEINKAMQDRCSRYLEAPIIGTPQLAGDRNLLLLCAGDKKLFDESIDYFKAIGFHAYFYGPVGNGAKVRLAYQMLRGATMAAVAEMMAFADTVGLNGSDMVQLVERSELCCPLINEAVKRISSENYLPPTYSLSGMQKELQYSINLASSWLSQPMFVGAAASQVFLAAKKAGLGNNDFSAVFKFLIPVKRENWENNNANANDNDDDDDNVQEVVI